MRQTIYNRNSGNEFHVTWPLVWSDSLHLNRRSVKVWRHRYVFKNLHKYRFSFTLLTEEPDWWRRPEVFDLCNKHFISCMLDCYTPRRRNILNTFLYAGLLKACAVVSDTKTLTDHLIPASCKVELLQIKPIVQHIPRWDLGNFRSQVNTQRIPQTLYKPLRSVEEHIILLRDIPAFREYRLYSCRAETILWVNRVI